MLPASTPLERPMKRTLVLLYGVTCYAVFFATFLYAIAFLGNFLIGNSIDAAPSISVGKAIAIDIALLAAFALQHSIMARPAFKRWWTRFVPAPAERSTYVLFSSLALILLFWLWQPIGAVIWQVDHPVGKAVLYAGYASGWVLLLIATFLINHFDLFGLRQSWLYFVGRPYTEIPFRTPGLYKVVRHPLYVGWLLAFWCTPTMTAAHLLFAVMTTAYILIAIQFEEHDLTHTFPEYASYRQRVPALIPFTRKRGAQRLARGVRQA
ncbi:methanethiol S-methyltransferase [Steroidobacter sp.]|uniref:methanethiol S-methyltransferase n=1 Tax=Steroidobacter sp. TaxID=1978227 RepID=UPI0032C245D2